MSQSTAEMRPTWEIARLFPLQGAWTEEDYLALDGNHLIELSDGYLEFPPMPTTSHQLIVAFLYGALLAFTSARDLGTVLFAVLRVRLRAKTIREPDIVFMFKEHADRMGESCWQGADLVMEVVSGGRMDRKRDLEVKRKEYAQAGIAEYWIVDPKIERITVLRLRGKRYIVHGEFPKGALASSHLLAGFNVEVTPAFSQQVRRPGAKSRRKQNRSTAD
jgi:Uma2 family endonuclease